MDHVCCMLLFRPQQSTSRPCVVQTRSHNTPKSGGNETLVVHRRGGGGGTCGRLVQDGEGAHGADLLSQGARALLDAHLEALVCQLPPAHPPSRTRRTSSVTRSQTPSFTHSPHTLHQALTAHPPPNTRRTRTHSVARWCSRHVGSAGRRGRRGTPTLALLIRIQRYSQSRHCIFVYTQSRHCKKTCPRSGRSRCEARLRAPRHVPPCSW